MPQFPRQPTEIDSMDKVRQMFDGYDCGVAYADATVGRLMNALEKAGVLDDTAVIISSDHGENLGELNIYGDHQTADHITGRVPLIVSWPGATESQAGSERSALVQNIDIPATTLELIGGQAPDIWEGQSFAQTLRGESDQAREQTIVSQGAWSLQRSVRWNEGENQWMCIRSYHEGHHGFPDVMLFELGSDPHEQHNLADEKPEVAAQGITRLDAWTGAMMAKSETGVDPFWTARREGGPLHTRGQSAQLSEAIARDAARRLGRLARSQTSERGFAASGNNIGNIGCVWLLHHPATFCDESKRISTATALSSRPMPVIDATVGALGLCCSCRYRM